MFNWLTKWGIKKWALKAVNNLLDSYSDNLQGALAVIDKYIAKVDSVMAFLKSTREKLADNKVTDDEADAIVEETGALVNSVLK